MVAEGVLMRSDEAWRELRFACAVRRPLARRLGLAAAMRRQGRALR